jgi:hypothetical protein
VETGDSLLDGQDERTYFVLITHLASTYLPTIRYLKILFQQDEICTNRGSRFSYALWGFGAQKKL